jgi:hypothetical protein
MTRLIDLEWEWDGVKSPPEAPEGERGSGREAEGKSAKESVGVGMDASRTMERITSMSIARFSSSGVASAEVTPTPRPVTPGREKLGTVMLWLWLWLWLWWWEELPKLCPA